MILAHNTFLLFCTSFLTSSATIFGLNKRGKKLFYSRVEYLNDSPFPYYPKTSGGDDFIVFDLGESTTLWCGYKFGVRSDGIYGVNLLEVKGLNGPYYNIKLNIGQSIFPVIEKLDRFQKWMDGKTFKGDWDADFLHSWNSMKKELDNLRILETKSQEKDKKKK